MLASSWHNRGLIKALVKREVIGRYRGSMLGLAWSFFNPIMMLVIYTFVFSGIFKARWDVSEHESKADFALVLFVGLIMHGLFAECINRAPSLITGNVSYVKKVIFPLEILPWVALGSALFHSAISVGVLLIAQLVINHHVAWTVLLFPIVLMPLIMFTMGFAWFLAALGVYVRDIGQMTSIFTVAMLFISAVFFPFSALPEQYRFWLELNPLALVIQEARMVLIAGQLPDFSKLAGMMVAGMISAWIGFSWFQRTRKGFADVL